MDATLTMNDGWREEDGGKVGLWLFILSEILLFGAFLASLAYLPLLLCVLVADKR